MCICTVCVYVKRLMGRGKAGNISEKIAQKKTSPEGEVYVNTIYCVLKSVLFSVKEK